MTAIPTEILSEVSDLLHILNEISELADAEKDAVGFWPKSALVDAINRRSLIALARTDRTSKNLVGYIQYSGAFPHAKVQQVAVKSEYRKSGFAAALLNKLISNLEAQGFLSLRADVAEDLQESLAFYRSNGFVQVFAKTGGKSRKRRILVHDRTLDTDDLFSLTSRSSTLELGIKRRSAGGRPIYAFDLNVYFDLVRDRAKSDLARKIFASALAHEVRLAVSLEFVKELERTSAGRVDDPLLQMALRLPTLPKVDTAKHGPLSDYVHDIVFVQTGNSAAGTAQARSDARHVAHAALARASGFVTRDRSLLDARDKLLDSVGIDIISTDELSELLPTGLIEQKPRQVGEGFSTEALNQQDFVRFLTQNGVDSKYYQFLDTELWISKHRFCEAIVSDGVVVAVGAADCPDGTVRSSRFLIFVEPSHSKASVFADYLIKRMEVAIGGGKPIAIQLVHLPGQSIVGSIAQSMSYRRTRSGEYYEKFSLGHPLTFSNWESSAAELRRCTGFVLPREIEEWDAEAVISVIYPSGEQADVRLADLEALLAPTILVTPELSGVIVAIERQYADDLLGTGLQDRFDFVENKDVSFVSTRGYINSPNRASLFQPDTPILFYESLGSGGRGAVVAVARIKDALVMEKNAVTGSVQKSLVVDKIEGFSSSSRVLVTTFDSLLPLPRACSLKELRRIGAIDGANLVSAKALNSNEIDAIMRFGWEGER